MATIQARGQMHAATFQEKMEELLGVAVNVVTADGTPADADATLGQIRSQQPTGTSLKVYGQSKLETIQQQVLDTFGVRITLREPDGTEAPLSDTLGALQRRHKAHEEENEPSPDNPSRQDNTDNDSDVSSIVELCQQCAARDLITDETKWDQYTKSAFSDPEVITYLTESEHAPEIFKSMVTGHYQSRGLKAVGELFDVLRPIDDSLSDNLDSCFMEDVESVRPVEHQEFLSALRNITQRYCRNGPSARLPWPSLLADEFRIPVDVQAHVQSETDNAWESIKITLDEQVIASALEEASTAQGFLRLATVLLPDDLPSPTETEDRQEHLSQAIEGLASAIDQSKAAENIALDDVLSVFRASEFWEPLSGEEGDDVQNAGLRIISKMLDSVEAEHKLNALLEFIGNEVCPDDTNADLRAKIRAAMDKVDDAWSIDGLPEIIES